MELLSSPSSPFVRKCRVLAIETGVDRDIAVVNLGVTPVAPNDRVNASNPVGKIPVLVLDDGSALHDSRVIAEYLDSRHTSTRMFPEEPAARWTALRLQSVGDGIMDAGVVMRFDSNVRPEPYRWRDFHDAQAGKVTRALDALEAEAAELGDGPGIGTITVACALGYLDFRFARIIDWRAGRPGLAAWYARFAARPSMQETMPSG